MDLDSPWADEADVSIAQENEWSKMAANFTNAGYREGIIAGKEAALQEGFDAGFAQVGAPLGHQLGILRGMASALIGFLSSNPPSTQSSSLADARDIAMQLAKVRLSDIAPPDLKAEAHAREHLGNDIDTDDNMPEEVTVTERREMEKLEDMMQGMSAIGDSVIVARPTAEDVRMLHERLCALSLSMSFVLPDCKS